MPSAISTRGPVRAAGSRYADGRRARRTHMRERAFRGSLLAVVMTAVVLAWVSPMHAQTTKLIFSSGPSGGSWIPLAAATAEVVRSAYPELAIDVEQGGTLVNMEKIMQDKAHLGWTMSTAMAEARARK